MLAFIWAGHSYAPDGSQIRTLLLNEFAKLRQGPLDRAPDAVRSLGRIGFVGTGSSSRALSTKASRLNTCRWVDMFGLLVAELRQQPIRQPDRCQSGLREPRRSDTGVRHGPRPPSRYRRGHHGFERFQRHEN